MVSGSRPANDEGLMRLSMARSYGTSVSEVERHGRMFAHMLVLGMALIAANPAFAQAPAAGACANAGFAAISAIPNTSMCANIRPCLSTSLTEVPYDRAMDSLIKPSSLAGLEPDTISISNVNLSLGTGAARVHILKDISLRVAQGEAIGLIGPSGSGKSTLLMVMAGLERPDSGEVVVNGTPFNALDEDALARFRRRHLGIVLQSLHLIPNLTALGHVAGPPELAGKPAASRAAAPEL